MNTLDDDLAPIGGHRPAAPDTAVPSAPHNVASSAGNSIGGLSAFGGDTLASLAPVGAGASAVHSRFPAASPTPDHRAVARPAPLPSEPRPYPLRPDTVPQENNGGVRRIGMIVGGGAAVVLALIAYFVFRTPPPVAAPASFASFRAADGSFTCDTPAGWETRAVGAAAGDTERLTVTDGVFVTSGSAKVEITLTSISAQAAGELVLGKETVPESMTGSPAGALHRRSKRILKNRLKAYQETAVAKFQSRMGGVIFEEGRFVPDARLSEYTAAGNQYGLGGKVHGYRASLTGPTMIASVVCQCSETDWQKLKPAFLRVIASLRDTVPTREPQAPALPGGIPMMGGGQGR